MLVPQAVKGTNGLGAADTCSKITDSSLVIYSLCKCLISMLKNKCLPCFGKVRKTECFFKPKVKRYVSFIFHD